MKTPWLSTSTSPDLVWRWISSTRNTRTSKCKSNSEDICSVELLNLSATRRSNQSPSRLSMKINTWLRISPARRVVTSNIILIQLNPKYSRTGACDAKTLLAIKQSKLFHGRFKQIKTGRSMKVKESKVSAKKPSWGANKNTKHLAVGHRAVYPKIWDVGDCAWHGWVLFASGVCEAGVVKWTWSTKVSSREKLAIHVINKKGFGIAKSSTLNEGCWWNRLP